MDEIGVIEFVLKHTASSINLDLLKYIKLIEETIIDLKQYGFSHKILSSKRIKITGISKSLIVNGLN